MNNIIINNLDGLEFVINGIVFKNGDKVKLNHSFFNKKKMKMENKIIDGVIKFKVYMDAEMYIDDYHLGLVVEIDGGNEKTLLDLFNEIIFE